MSGCRDATPAWKSRGMRGVNKEQLGWEKELVGVYLSSHPLQRFAEEHGTESVTWTGDLTEELAGQMVSFAGVVTGVREIPTRRNEPMAFVEMEDLQGSVEVTVFPRTYRETKELWVTDKILFLRAKVEVRPLLLLEAEVDGGRYTTILQNAETIRLCTRDGSISVSEIKEGDRVLVRLEKGGRHFGHAVKESVVER